MKSSPFQKTLNFPKINKPSPAFHDLLLRPAFRYLGENACPFEIKNRFSGLLNEICLLWGDNIKKEHTNLLLRALNNSLSFESIDEKLAIIERTLSNHSYNKSRDERIEIIENLGLTYGYVYVLSNNDMRGYIKIGMTETTDRSGHERARELSTTGVPGKYSVEFQRITFNPGDAEDQILINFEDYLKRKGYGERLISGNGVKQELFRIRKRDYVIIAINYIKGALRNYEKSIFDKIDLEISRERKLIELLKRIHAIIQNGISKEVLKPVTDDLKTKVRYLSHKRQLDTFFPTIDSSGIAFYKAVNHCIEWLDFLLKNDEIDNCSSPELKNHISISIENTIGLLPKALSKIR